MNHFVRPARKCVVEFLDRNYQEVPAPEGTFVMPGHAIEAMWFVMRRAMARNDRNTIRHAAEVIALAFGKRVGPGVRRDFPGHGCRRPSAIPAEFRNQTLVAAH